MEEDRDLLIAMHSSRGKRRQTNRDILGAPRFRRGVLDPLTGIGDHGLPSPHLETSGFVLNSQHSFQYNRELYEFWRLSRLNPTFGAAHVCNARGGGPAGHAANVFVDDFGLVPRSFNPSRLRDQSGHGKTIAVGTTAAKGDCLEEALTSGLKAGVSQQMEAIKRGNRLDPPVASS